MAHSIPPTPLSLRRRINLLTARLIALVAVLIDRIRPLPKAPGEVSEHRYGPDAAETLQFIAPSPSAPKRTPLVFIHGGGWIIMRNRVYTRELIDFANQGYPVFNLEYPLAPKNPHPGILLSLLGALEWIRTQHPHVEGVHLMGDSAGGNLAMMLAIFSKNASLLRGLGPSAPQEFPIAIRSVVSLYGVLDRRTWLDNRFPGAPLMLECYGGKAVFEERVPAEKAITPMDLEFDAYPPTFLAVGSKDRLSESTRVLGRRLSDMPGVSRCEVYADEIHGFFNMHWRPGYQGLRQDIFDFFAAHDTKARPQTETQHAEVTA